MIHTLLNHLKINRAELEEIKEYFSRCSDEIDRRNLFMLRRVCMYTSLIYLGMIILAYFIVPEFSLNLGHIAIIPVLLIYMVVNVYTRNRENITGIKAREFGADEVLTIDDPNETFALTIKELSGV